MKQAGTPRTYRGPCRKRCWSGAGGAGRSAAEAPGGLGEAVALDGRLAAPSSPPSPTHLQTWVSLQGLDRGREEMTCVKQTDEHEGWGRSPKNRLTSGQWVGGAGQPRVLRTEGLGSSRSRLGPRPPGPTSPGGRLSIPVMVAGGTALRPRGGVPTRRAHRWAVPELWALSAPRRCGGQGTSF